MLPIKTLGRVANGLQVSPERRVRTSLRAMSEPLKPASSLVRQVVKISSTAAVGEILNGHPCVAFCNVYGVEVPRADGRAGMASMVLADDVEDLDVDGFSAYVVEHLPGYARPVFLRIQPEMGTTGTFKMVKGDLRKEGYDLAQVSDAVYVLKPGASTYERLDSTFAAKISAGEAGY